MVILPDEKDSTKFHKIYTSAYHNNHSTVVIKKLCWKANKWPWLYALSKCLY